MSKLSSWIFAAAIGLLVAAIAFVYAGYQDVAAVCAVVSALLPFAGLFAVVCELA